MVPQEAEEVKWKFIAPRPLGVSLEAILTPMSIGVRKNRVQGRRIQRHLGILLLWTLTSCAPVEEVEDLDFQRGRNALAMARYDWARFYFSTDLETHPDRLESLRGLGISWISGYQGSLTHGVEAIENYLLRAPEDSEMRLRLVRSLLSVGDGDRAQDALEGLEESIEKQLLLVKIHLSEDPDAAREILAPILHEDPDLFDVHHLAAKIYLRLGDDAEALVQARRASEIHPLSAEIFYLTAQILRRQGHEVETEEALATYEILHQLPGPGSPPDPKKELALLRQLGERQGRSASSFKKRFIRLLIENGRLTELTPLLEELRNDPNSDTATLLALAQSAHIRGMSSMARNLYEDVLERDPTHQKAVAQRALLAYETHDFETAEQYLARGLEVDPHQAPLHFTTGLLALSQGDEERAVEAFTSAVDLVPWLVRYRLTLADVLLTRGDRAAVEDLLAAAPAADPAIDAYKKKHTL